MTYNDEEQDAEEEEEDESFSCNLCGDDFDGEELALNFISEDENEIDICKGCWKLLVEAAQEDNLLPTAETKVVEKVIEKPVEKLVEKIVYRTVDKNGNEVGQAKTNWTKFDC